MAWSTPLTAVANAALTAAQWNASVRDNLNETAVAKATTAGYHFASAGTNSLVERAILSATVSPAETTTSTTYTDLATLGPSVTLVTGTKSLVWIGSACSNSGSNSSIAAISVSGGTGGGVDNSVNNVGTSTTRSGCCWFASGLTAGSNTIFMQYRVSAGTGTFSSRTISVMGL